MTDRLKEKPNQTNPSLVSVVIPVYEEEDTIEQVIREVIQVMKPLEIGFEVIPVDDGSRDQSFERLRALQKECPGVMRIARHVYNKGNGAALRTGIRCARGEIVICMDGDGQHSAQDIPGMIAMIPPYDMVVGYRTERYQGSPFRGWGNRFFNHFASWLSSFDVRDLTSGFRAMRRTAVEHFLPMYPAGFSAPLTVTMAFLKAGYNVAYLPVTFHKRGGGKSKINLLSDGGRFFTMLLRIVILYDPMRIFIPISILIGILGIITMTASILKESRFFFPNSAILFFFSALFIFLMGLVTSQIVSSQIHYFGDESVSIYEDETV